MIARKLLSMGILGALALPFLTGCGAATQIMQLEMREMKSRLAHLESEFGRHEESIREIRTNTQAAPAIQPGPAEALPVVHPRSAKPSEQPRRPMSTRDVLARRRFTPSAEGARPVGAGGGTSVLMPGRTRSRSRSRPRT